MGEFILLGAQEQAAENSVEAEGVTREGQIEDEIISYCSELDPSYVIFGRPQAEQEDNLLSNEQLQAFADRITDVCSATIVLPSE